MQTEDLLSMALVAVIAATVILWLRLNTPRTRLFAQAGALFWTALLLEALGMLTRSWAWNNNPAYNLFQAYEFILLLFLVRAAEPSMGHMVRWVGILGVISFVWSIYQQKGFHLLSGSSILVFGSLLTVVLVRLLFLMARKSNLPLQSMPSFWLFLGCLIYFAGLVPLIGGVRLLYTRDPVLAADLWGSIPVLGILRYALAAWACRLEHQRSFSS